MELRQIRFAVAVAEDRHFGRAAERMFIAQPALSQHVRRLERELGAQLFDRGTRHVRVTPAGEAFLGVARHLLRQADEAMAAARRAEAGEIGSVSVGASLPGAGPLLSVTLRRWVAARPGVRPRMVTGRPRELVDLVRRRELDVALVEEPSPDPQLQAVPLVDDPVVVLLPVRHRLARDERLEVGALAGERLVSVSRDSAPALHERALALCAAAGVRPTDALEVDEPGLVPVAVGAGLGVGMVPQALAVGTAFPDVTWRPLVDDGSVVTLAAVAAAEGATPQARDLLELLVDLRDRQALRPSGGRHLELAHPPGARTAS